MNLMPGKLKVYLETSVPSFVFNDHLPDEQEIAKEIIAKAQRGEIKAFVSDTVVAELSASPEPRRTKLLELIKSFEQLPTTKEVEYLAKEYIKRGIIPKNKVNDALHLATASAHAIRVIASWNVEHIVKLKTKMGIAAINTDLGYHVPEIVRPEELVDLNI